MLYAASRYANTSNTVDVMLVQPSGAQLRTLIRRPNFTGTVGVTTHRWRAGDRLDRLAQMYLGSPTKWWAIMDANPEIPNPAGIAPGTLLRIPRG